MVSFVDSPRQRIVTLQSTSGALDSTATNITVYKWNNANEMTNAFTYSTYSAYNASTFTTQVIYGYDPGGLLVSRTQKNSSGTVTAAEDYVLDGQSVALVLAAAALNSYTPGQITQRELYGPAVDQILASEAVPTTQGSGTVSWMFTDGEDSVRDVATYGSSTTVTDHLVYDPFGQLAYQSSSGNQPRFLYTARPLDSVTGLYYDRARWYSPVDGNWISQDPLGFNAGDSNLSRYVGNNPMNMVDPSGMMSEQDAQNQYNSELSTIDWTKSNALYLEQTAYTHFLQNYQQALGVPVGPGKRPVGLSGVSWYTGIGTNGIYWFPKRLPKGTIVPPPPDRTKIPEQDPYDYYLKNPSKQDPALKYGSYAAWTTAVVAAIGAAIAAAVPAAVAAASGTTATGAAGAGGTAIAAAETPQGQQVITELEEEAPVLAQQIQQGAQNLMNCFPAGTPVATPKGLVAIESIKSGDEVWSYDLIKSEWCKRTVLRTFVSDHDGTSATITIAGEEIEATALHPFWVVGKGKVPSTGFDKYGQFK